MRTQNKKLSGESLRRAVVPVKKELGAEDNKRLDALVALGGAEKIRLSDVYEKLYPEKGDPDAGASFRNFRKLVNDKAKELKLELRLGGDSKKRDQPQDRHVWFTGPDLTEEAVAEFSGKAAEQTIEGGYVPPRGLATNLQRLDDPVRRAEVGKSEGVDAMAELERWACDTAANSPFFAVLGEYGIGKTTLLKEFTIRGLTLRKEGKEFPLPIYLDLRHCDLEPNGPVPTTEEILGSILKRECRAVDRGGLLATADILRLVREEGAVVIFDGLDEKLVHLPPDKARVFIRSLWGTLDRSRPAAGESARRPGKMILSCRSHYFRDIGSQNSMLSGEDREGVPKKDFPALILLPFHEEQIRAYLASALDGGDAEAGRERAESALQLIRRVHNLRELAERPYLLGLIRGQIGNLETLAASGERVNAARLYDLMAREWLNRDEGKHQLDPLHKRRLMEALAAAMWRTGEKAWDADRLEAWLDRFLHAHPEIAGAYGNKDRKVLKEDLRTATFVLRPDIEERAFRFAHSSLQEYFLARHLHRALESGDVSAWEIPLASPETLAFLGELLQFDRVENVAARLGAMLASDRPAVALNAFRYWLRAVEGGYPEPTPSVINLGGAELEGLVIRGHGADRPLNLRGANLSRARMNRAELRHVDLGGADLNGAELAQAVLVDVRAEGITAQQLDLGGTRWRGGSLAGASMGSAKLEGTEFVGVDLDEVQWPKDHRSLASAARGEGEVFPAPGGVDAGLLAGWRSEGHSEAVNACGWSPDGSRIVSGSEDGALKVWEAGSGRCLRTLEGHGGGVMACGWSPDGSRLVSGSDDGTLKVWESESGRCLRTLEGHKTVVNACGWSPDGSRLVSGSSDGTLKVWDAGSGQCLRTFEGHSGWVMACGWSPDGSRLVSGSDDRTLKVWDAGSGLCLRTFEGHEHWVMACGWSPDGSRIVSGAYDGTLKVWDAGSGLCLRTLGRHSEAVNACGWSPDGSRIVSGLDDGTLKVWDAGSGLCLRTFEGHEHWVMACGWSPDGSRIVSGAYDGTLKVWDAGSGLCLRTLGRHSEAVNACGWSPDGSRIVSGSWDGTLKVWEAGSGRCLRTLEGRKNWVIACGWSLDGSRLVSGSNDGTLKVWDVGSGRCLWTLEGHKKWVMGCGWSPDGSRLVSGAEDGALKVWEAGSGQCLRTLEGHKNWVMACGWSPDGSQIVSGSDDGTLKVWEAGSGQCLRTLEGHSKGVRACGWSRDGSRIVSGSDDGTLKVWDAGSVRCLRTLEGHKNWVRACGWSPDGSRIVSGSSDGTLKVWEAESGRCLRTLEGHAEGVMACGWSPDGSRIVSGSSDGTLRVWDAESGRCLRTLEGHKKAVMSCGWSPDGSRIVSGANDGTIRLWSAEDDACLRVGLQFRDGEWASYDPVGRRYLATSPEAWRHVGWQATELETGRLRILPLEFFPERCGV